MLAERSDLDLIARFKKGDVACFEILISRYADKAFNLAMRLTRNTQDAEEVLQDVFSTVYRKVNRFEGKSQFSSWLYRITVNAAFMRLRRNRRRKMVSLEEINEQTRESWVCKRSEGVTAEGQAYRTQLREALEEAVSQLPDEYRAVFVLRDIDGLSNREVSSVLELTVPAVKSRVHRARMMLRRRLRLYWEQEQVSAVSDGQ